MSISFEFWTSISQVCLMVQPTSALSLSKSRFDQYLLIVAQFHVDLLADRDVLDAGGADEGVEFVGRDEAEGFDPAVG